MARDVLPRARPQNDVAGSRAKRAHACRSCTGFLRSRMKAGFRYRIDEGLFCIDIRLKSSRQLFDGRDPAPFRERDLDEHAVEYLVGAVSELPRDAPVKLVFWISDEPAPQLPDTMLVEAVRAHFTYEEQRLGRRARQHIRRGQLFFLVGATVLVLFLTLAELTTAMPTGRVRQILREGLVITAWVAMWRPLEALLYDWWPLVQEHRLQRRLRDVPIEVHHQREPDGVAADAEPGDAPESSSPS